MICIARPVSHSECIADQTIRIARTAIDNAYDYLGDLNAPMLAGCQHDAPGRHYDPTIGRCSPPWDRGHE
jgi:hypothetical protein